MATGSLLAGYDCSFVVPLPRDLQSECSICLHILREPYLVGCCGYRFCRCCIEPIQKKAFRRCPLCNNKNFSSLPDKQLERTLNEKLVYCSHKSDGCKWKGRLVELENHVSPGKYETGCLFSRVACYYCKNLFYRFAIEDHAKTCTFREVACTYCKTHKDTPRKLETQHFHECLMYPVVCPNGCGAKPLRKNVSKHVDDNCPLAMIECPFKYAGCEVTMTRTEMANHSSMEDHLILAVARIMELEDENAQLKKLLSKRNQPAASAADSIEYLYVDNLPPEANVQMLKCVFGQYGCVEAIKMCGKHSAKVTYKEECSAQAALSRSEVTGINLKSVRLSVQP